MIMASQPEMLHRRQAFPPRISGSWSCMRVADEVWGARTHIRRPHYDRCFLAVVLSGTALISSGGEREQARAGQVWSMQAGNSYQVTVQETMHILLMVGGGAQLTRRLRAASEGEPAVWSPLRPQTIEALMHETLSVAEEGGPHIDSIGSNSLRLIVDLLSHAPQQRIGGTAQATYQACRETMQREALQLQSVSDAADSCGIDRAYLSRLFKRYAAESPALFLTRCKMQHAAQELASGSSVADTAHACAYKSPDVFTRAFQRHYGMTPRRWRQQLD